MFHVFPPFLLTVAGIRSMANTSERESVLDFSGTGGGPAGVVDGSPAAEKKRTYVSFMPQSYVSRGALPIS